MRIVISGGWSYGNFGDEVIAASTIYLVERFFPQAEKVYTAYNVNDFEKNHEIKAVASIHKYIDKLDNNQLKVEKIIACPKAFGLNEYESLFDENSILIMSGGGYLHEGWRSQFIARILEIEIAKKHGAKVFVIGQSIGPLFSEKCKNKLIDALDKVDYLSVRDASSKYLLENLGVRVEIHNSPDLAIIVSDFLPFQKKERKQKIISIMPASYNNYVKVTDHKSRNKYLAKIEKRISLSSLNYTRELKKFVAAVLKQEQWKVQIVLSTSWSWDKKFVMQLIEKNEKNRLKVCESETYKDLCYFLAQGDITVSTKMHPLIISSSYDIPVIGISYNYKIDDFMQLIKNSEACLNINSIQASVLLKHLKEEKEPSNINELKFKVYNMFEQLSKLE